MMKKAMYCYSENMIIKTFETLPSTNTYALEHFDELQDFCVISANTQTQGRGRFDRNWVSNEKENIYLSFVLKPENKTYLPNLTQYLSVVTAKVIAQYAVTPQIKWPNDVLINGKKICGILCESKLKQNKLQGVVLGIGINLNMSQETIDSIDRPATALNLETDLKIDKKDFLNKLLTEFEKGYKDAIEQGFLSFKDDYLKLTNFLGQKVFIQQRDNAPKEEYIASKIDDNGNLIVLTSENTEKTILSGDLILNI